MSHLPRISVHSTFACVAYDQTVTTHSYRVLQGTVSSVIHACSCWNRLLGCEKAHGAKC